MRILIFCFLFFICLRSFSQTIDVDKTEKRSAAINNLFTASGTPYVEAKFVRLVSGSPFFNEKMMRGILISPNGTEYRNIIIRLNLMESQVNFLNNKQEELIVGTPLREVTLLDTVNKKNYYFIFSDYIETSGKPEKGFYQILQKGKAGLYTQHKKTLKETRPFNSATYEQSIETNLTYFVLLGGQWKKINKIKDLPSVLSDKKTEVQEYINSKGLSGYKQEVVESVINYYNSLFENKQ
jgi:hypothetical protein